MKPYVIALVVLLAGDFAPAANQADDCTLGFKGKYRESIKLRRAGLAYQKYNAGHPITLTEWYTLTTQLSQNLGTGRSDIPTDHPIANRETIEVTLRCYLLAVRFEKHTAEGDGKDNEFHIEVGETPAWEGRHVVVEVATGASSCNARKTAWNLALADAGPNQPPTVLRIFGDPPEVLVTGYLFVDGWHAHSGMTPTKWGQDSGGRGIQRPLPSVVKHGKTIKKHMPSQVHGLWEIHPITSLIPAH